MTESQKKIMSTVLVQINPGTIIDEQMITTLVNGNCLMMPITDPTLPPLTEEEKKEVIAELQTRLAIRMDRGACVKEKNHVPWYYAAKAKLPSHFWDRYRTYLFKDAGFNSDVVDALDASTDEMMDLLSNPQANIDFQRRGLVIGDVQSGKTSNYIALMNKAADAGYRIIILLSGTIEKLRRQTQGRVDEGFVGLDSTAFIRDRNNVLVGVGSIDPSMNGWAVTSTSSDFNTGTANRVSGQLAHVQVPVVFVLKKNKSVLEKLESWLRLYNANPVTKQIDLPMLMIDDEADNASVNTKDNDDPTAINKNIRKILKLFSKASYVGFTATPYANIFIDPDSTQEMLDDDLFPRDFIYALEAPTNYIGASRIFPKDGKYHYMIKDNSDCEGYVPIKHKKDYIPGSIPYSLSQAVASFMLANAIRDLRGQTKKHRTMMINISIYIDVQKRIAEQLDRYVREMQREIKNYYMTGKNALQYSTFALLKDVFDTHYPNIEFSWEEVQCALHEAVAPIVVRYVNGGNAAKNLNYDECDEKDGQDGLRIIAVGGYSLSRGLTLEGLCCSYFYRNTKMYDTLMQMGRWFGYRPKYEDTCQVWINPEAVEWYSYIAEASEELKSEVRRMQHENRTPKDFGLCVRSDITALLVTARNKMKTAQDYTMTVSLSGNIVETPFIHVNKSILADNLELTKRLFADMEESGLRPIINDPEMAIKQAQYLSVPKSFVIDYLRAFQEHSMNSHFHTKEIVDMIVGATDSSLDNWDIVIASGNGSLPAEFASVSQPCVERSFRIRTDYEAYQMSGSKSRLGNRSYAKGGLTKKVAEHIEACEREAQAARNQPIRPLNQDVFFKPNYTDKPRNPLLVIYPVQLIYSTEPGEQIDLERQAAVNSISTPMIGLSVGVPRIPGREPKQYQYKINIVKYREIMGFDNEAENESDETIED